MYIRDYIKKTSFHGPKRISTPKRKKYDFEAFFNHPGKRPQTGWGGKMMMRTHMGAHRSRHMRAPESRHIRAHTHGSTHI